MIIRDISYDSCIRGNVKVVMITQVKHKETPYIHPYDLFSLSYQPPSTNTSKPLLRGIHLSTSLQIQKKRKKNSACTTAHMNEIILRSSSSSSSDNKHSNNSISIKSEKGLETYAEPRPSELPVSPTKKTTFYRRTYTVLQ